MDMKGTNTYEVFRMLHEMELRELKQAVKDFGGEVHFGMDYVGSDGSGTERPIICVNRSKGDGPEDVYINACKVTDDHLDILAETKAFGDTFILCHDDIEFGHVSFITDLVPQRKLDLGKDAYGFSETLVEFSHLLYDKLYEKYGDSFEVMHEIYDIAFKFECELKERGMYDDDEDYLIAIDKHAEKIIAEL